MKHHLRAMGVATVYSAVQCQGLTTGDLINMLKYYSCNLFIQEQGNIIHGRSSFVPLQRLFIFNLFRSMELQNDELSSWLRLSGGNL